MTDDLIIPPVSPCPPPGSLSVQYLSCLVSTPFPSRHQSSSLPLCWNVCPQLFYLYVFFVCRHRMLLSVQSSSVIFLEACATLVVLAFIWFECNVHLISYIMELINGPFIYVNCFNNSLALFSCLWTFIFQPEIKCHVNNFWRELLVIQFTKSCSFFPQVQIAANKTGRNSLAGASSFPATLPTGHGMRRRRHAQRWAPLC